MIDYLKTYYSFIEAHKVQVPKARAKEMKLESHHVIPRAVGGIGLKFNRVFMTEYDHSFAHLLLNIARVQNKSGAINYTPRSCLKARDKNLVQYWNPMSKVKIKVTDPIGNIVVLTILAAAKILCTLRKACWESQKTKNRCVKDLLSVACYGNHKYFQNTWELMV